MLAVAQIHRRRGLRPGIGGAHDALGVDDGDLHDDLAQHVGGADDGVEIGAFSPALDRAAQIKQRLVDLAERAQHILFERHREILAGALRVLQVAAIVFIVF